MQGLAAFIKLARLQNTLLPLVAAGAGFTIAGGQNYTQLALSLLVLVLLHTVVTIWNDIADEAADRHNGITRMRDLRRAGAYPILRGCLVASVAVGIFTLAFLPLTIVLLICLYLLLAWAYNVRPLQFSRRPILSIVLLGLAYGTLPFMVGASLGHVGWASIVLGIGWTVGRGSLSLLKDYKDARGDAVANKRTFLLVFGGTLTARLSFVLALLAYATCLAVVASELKDAAVILVWMSGVSLWLLYERAKLFRATEYAALNQIFHDCVRYQLIFDGFLVLCLHTS